MSDVPINYNITATDAGARAAFEAIDKEVKNTTETIAGMRNRISALNKTIENTKIGSEGYKYLNSEMKNLTSTTQRYNAVGINTARLFSDAGYAAQSFSMGVMSMGNNISPLIESFNQARASGQSFKQILVSTFTGTSGILVGINIVISAITAFAIANRSSAEEMSKNKDEVKKLADEMARMSKVGLNDAIFNTEKEVELLRKKNVIEKIAFDDREKMKERVMAARGELYTQGTYGGFSAQAELDKQSELLGKYQTQVAILGDLNNIKNRIAELDKKRNEARGENAQAERDNLTAQIKLLQDQQKLMEGDLGKTAKLKITTWIDNEELDEKIEDFKERIAKEKAYFNIVAFADPKAMQFFMNEIKKQAEEMAAIGLDGEKYLIVEKKKLWQSFINWRNQNDPMFKPPTKIDNYKKPGLLDYEKGGKSDEELYSDVVRNFSKLGHQLSSIFKNAGDTFVGKMADALDIVTQIVSIIQTISAIGSFLSMLTTVASVAAAPATGGASLLPMLFSQGSTINVNIGGRTVARLVSEGQAMATNLRYA